MTRWVSPVLACPTPFTSMSSPTTKMMTRISFDTINATVTSIQRRTHEAVMSASDPAKASGANTAEMTMSTLRTVSAAHTNPTATRAAMEKMMIAAGFEDAPEIVDPVRMACPTWLRIARWRPAPRRPIRRRPRPARCRWRRWQ